MPSDDLRTAIVIATLKTWGSGVIPTSVTLSAAEQVARERLAAKDAEIAAFDERVAHLEASIGHTKTMLGDVRAGLAERDQRITAALAAVNRCSPHTSMGIAAPTIRAALTAPPAASEATQVHCSECHCEGWHGPACSGSEAYNRPAPAEQDGEA